MLKFYHRIFIRRIILKNKENWLILLFASAYISISAFTFLIILFLIYEIKKIIEKEIKFEGIFKLPLFIIIFASASSTLIYGSLKEIPGVLNQTFFNITYFAKNLFNPSKELFKKINYTIVFFCFIESIVTVYNYFHGNIKPIWGGVFEVGIVFTLGSLSAFTLFLVEKEVKKKILFFTLFLLFTGMVFLPAKRNPVLGLIVSYTVYFIILVRYANIRKQWIYGLITVFIISSFAGVVYMLEEDNKYKRMLITLIEGKEISESQINEFSSLRWEIGKKGIEVIKKDFENVNIVPIFIGHGYNAGQRLDPPSPVGRSYESIFFISEFINIGLIGLFGLLLMMYRFFKFVLSVKIKSLEDVVCFPFLIFPAYFLVGGIFSGIWDAILALYFLMFGIAEKYYLENKNL